MRRGSLPCSTPEIHSSHEQQLHNIHAQSVRQGISCELCSEIRSEGSSLRLKSNMVGSALGYERNSTMAGRNQSPVNLGCEAEISINELVTGNREVATTVQRSDGRWPDAEVRGSLTVRWLGGYSIGLLRLKLLMVWSIPSRGTCGTRSYD
jgi:hypothetical protein